MLRKQLTAISLAITLTLGYSGAVYADTLSTSTVVMENCGAYLFEWRPVGYDNGKYRRSLAMDPYGKKEPASANTVPVLFLLFSAWLIACVGMVGI